MRRRHLPPRLPRLWLMTDERMGDGLWDALARLPRGGGVVFRYYATPEGERRRMFAKVSRVARRRGLVVVRAGARAMSGEGGTHNRIQRSRGLRTFAVHTARDAVRAQRAAADAVFVSPVFATRSHPGAKALGVVRLGLLMRGIRVPVIALGGMDAARLRRLRGLGVYGWAGIDAWLDGPDAAKPVSGRSCPQHDLKSVGAFYLKLVGRSCATPAGLSADVLISGR